MTSELIEIPKALPVMTLRGVVLFPKAMMPLRIFEERYRQMLDEVLNTTRIFGIVCEREDVAEDEIHLEPPFGVATAGLIRVSKKHDDGTSFVLLQGINRVKVKGIVQEMPYRIIEAEEIKSIHNDYSQDTRKEIEEALEQNKLLGGEVTDEMLEFLNPLDDDDAFVDLATFTLCRHTLRKQAMLEVEDLSKRASMLLTDLHRENDRLATIKLMMKKSDEKGLEEN
ncbi:MAG: LON peptidase substrate-binding domain-containing protein [Verrucomicrobiota bacterium]|nr:LON peptidase substrate-binding domain-containing protein [Verrucomicrobiota bacterium]MEC8244442.1 LON peptidase substrate-binding domain-containing protein [Verrucomicrobiota bacterium]